MNGDMRDPEFLKMLERGQEEFQQFRKARRHLSDHGILREYVDQHGLVFGVFKDPENALGWDTVIIKGHDALTAIIASGMAQQKTVGVIPCRNIEEALAMGKSLAMSTPAVHETGARND